MQHCKDAAEKVDRIVHNVFKLLKANSVVYIVLAHKARPGIWYHSVYSFCFIYYCLQMNSTMLSIEICIIACLKSLGNFSKYFISTKKPHGQNRFMNKNNSNFIRCLLYSPCVAASRTPAGIWRTAARLRLESRAPAARGHERLLSAVRAEGWRGDSPCVTGEPKHNGFFRLISGTHHANASGGISVRNDEFFSETVAKVICSAWTVETCYGWN